MLLMRLWQLTKGTISLRLLAFHFNAISDKLLLNWEEEKTYWKCTAKWRNELTKNCFWIVKIRRDLIRDDGTTDKRKDAMTFFCPVTKRVFWFFFVVKGLLNEVNWRFILTSIIFSHFYQNKYCRLLLTKNVWFNSIKFIGPNSAKNMRNRQGLFSITI